MSTADFLHYLMLGTEDVKGYSEKSGETGGNGEGGTGGNGEGGAVTYEKLVDVKDTPDIYGEIEAYEITTKSDVVRKYKPGIKANEVKVFTANYDTTDFETLKALEGTEQMFAEYLGDLDGSLGKFGYTGYLQVRVLGSGVGEPHDMQIRILPTSDIELLD